MAGRIDFEFGFNKPGARRSRSGGSGYRIYVMGNFSGRSALALAQRKITAIDIDSFDQVMARIRPTLEANAGLTLSFENLDDFHPDVWLRRIPILADLLELKRQLSNPATAEQAAAKIKAFLPVEAQHGKSAPPQQAGETNEQTLERLLGKKPETPDAKTDTVDRLIQQIMSPYVSKQAEPQHLTLINIIDQTLGQYLRALLHRQDFRGLESLWRAVAEMINEQDCDQHRFFLIDIDQAELLSELKDQVKRFEQQLLAHIQSADDEQQVLLLGDVYFSGNADDAELLGLCSRLAKACNGYFLGAAADSLLETAAGNVQHWQQYLEHICADRLILTYPRYLLRLPYGRERDPLDSLVFEECADIPQTSELLWGNPAFLSVRVLIRDSQEPTAEDACFFGDIPCFAFEKEGEQVLQPGVEAVMTENQANALVAGGIMPVIGYHRRQGVRLIALSTLRRSD